MRRTGNLLALAMALAITPVAADARGFSVEVWTDRGNEAVYRPDERMTVKVRSSDDANLLVYEIDAEGYINVLFPDQGGAGFVEGKRTYQFPPEDANVELVVREPVGQCYLVAIASMMPFEELPWYLRPYNAQAEEVGYVGEPRDEEGVTAEGRIVGDPFVAMERIRRRVLTNATDGETFATAYTTYYVHQAVRYPRYLCYDCHRPNQWSWWDGFDPYYTSCSVFNVRVNWSWYWGPRYWYGYVPYFVYAYRPDCPPRYSAYYQSGGWCSSWDGWSSWTNLWGAGTLRRFKSPPPPGYTAPSKFGPNNKWKPGAATPPGFLTGNVRSGRGLSPLMPVGRSGEVRGDGGGAITRTERPVGEVGRRETMTGAPTQDVSMEPIVRHPRDEEAPAVIRRADRGAPATSAPRQEAGSRYTPRGAAPPAPAAQSGRVEGRSRQAPRGGASRGSRQESRSWFAPPSSESSGPPIPETQAPPVSQPPPQMRQAPAPPPPPAPSYGQGAPSRGQGQSPATGRGSGGGGRSTGAARGARGGS